MKWRLLMLGVGLLLAWSAPAGADNAQLMQLIEILHKKGTLNQEEYRMLVGAAQEASASRPLAASGEKPAPPAPVAKTEAAAGEGLQLTSADGGLEVKVGGRLQVDTGLYGSDVADNASGTELRRARLDVSGRFEKDWKFKLSYDFADNAVEDKSAYLAYEGWKGWSVKAGLYGMPLGLAEATGSLYGIFIEEPMIVSAFKLDERIGLGAETWGERWSAQLALFGENAAANVVDDESHGVAARATWAPVLDKTRVLHLGGSLVYQSPESVNEGNNDRNGNGIRNENVRTTRFRSRPEAHVNMGRFVDTGAIYNVDALYTAGLEMAGVWGALSMEAETMRTWVARSSGGQPDLGFGGYYASLGWFLTGESRNYEVKSGAFGRIKPFRNFDWQQGGRGAWEVATRYSVLDLNDENVRGGEERNLTFGLNWYLNPRLRIMANYVLVDTTAAEDPKLFQTRLQFDF
ncbi:MAG: hypothetical protein HQM03_04040 [Magnetococcales bacterium]|nr:hypothetical protein [Magnetococcales bacterium]